MSEAKQHVFLTGGTGHMGSRLIPRLLVTLEQMLQVLTDAVESPATGVRVIEVPEMRAGLAKPALGAVSAQ